MRKEMKKIVLAALLGLAVSGGAWAQKNILSGGWGAMINIPLVFGTEVFMDYERKIIPQFGFGATVSGNFFPLALFAIVGTDGKIDNIFGYTVEVQARWYPFGGSFHIDGGIGFNHFLTSMPCFVIVTDLGWNITLGKSPMRLNIEPIHLEFFVPLGNNPLKYLPEDSETWEEIRPFNTGLRISLGYAF